MDDKKIKPQVNVDFSKSPELLIDLDKLVKEDGTDRSKFIRKLVRQEIARRQQLPLPFIEQPKRRKNGAHTAQAVAA